MTKQMCTEGQSLARHNSEADNRYKAKLREFHQKPEAQRTSQDHQELQQLQSAAAQSANAFNTHKAQCSQCQ